MDDRTALERQVGEELRHEMGAAPEFDPATVAHEAATATSPGRQTTVTRWRPSWSSTWSERGLSMYSAVKFAVATMVIGLFGGFLLAGAVGDPQEPHTPAAPATLHDVARVDGVLRVGAVGNDPGDVGDTRIEYHDQVVPVTLEVDDQRLSSSGTEWSNSDMLVGAEGQRVGASSLRLTNEDGSWVGTGRLFLDGSGVYELLRLRGEEGYEGLSAILFLHDDKVDRVARVRGVIFPGEAPPDPGPVDANPYFDATAHGSTEGASDAAASVAGRMRDIGTVEWGTIDEDVEGRLRTLGIWLHSELEIDDPRLAGAWSQLANQDLFIGATGESVSTASVRIDNAGGAWTGPRVEIIDEVVRGFSTLTGDGAYEGLVAVLFDETDSTRLVVRGLILPGALPEVPSLPDSET